MSTGHGPRARRLLTVLASVVLLAAACGDSDEASPQGSETTTSTAASGSPTDALAAIIEGAEDEGVELNLNWGGFVLDPELLEQLREGFNDYYDLDLTIQHSPEPSLSRAASVLIEESNAGRSASTDVYQGNEVFTVDVIDAGVIEEVDWSSFADNLQDDELVSADGAAVSVTADVAGIAYNTDSVPEEDVPETLEELLEAADGYRVAVTVGARNFEVLATPELEIWSEKETRDYLEDLADRAAGFMRCFEVGRVASGEFDMLAFECGRAATLLLTEDGAPVASSIPEEGATVQWGYVSVPVHAEHPNTAKLWVNYLLTPEAQALIYDAEGWDNPLVEGSRTAEFLEELEADGARLIDRTVDFALDNREIYDEFLVELNTILEANAAG